MAAVQVVRAKWGWCRCRIWIRMDVVVDLWCATTACSGRLVPPPDQTDTGRPHVLRPAINRPHVRQQTNSKLPRTEGCVVSKGTGDYRVAGLGLVREVAVGQGDVCLTDGQEAQQLGVARPAWGQKM